MVDAILVHVIDCLQDLVHVVLDSMLGQVVSSPLDGFIHVIVHQLKYQGEPPCGFIVENFMQSDDIWVGRKPFQSLDLSQVVDLIYVVEVRFHAFYGHILPSLNRLSFEHL